MLPKVLTLHSTLEVEDITLDDETLPVPEVGTLHWLSTLIQCSV